MSILLELLTYLTQKHGVLPGLVIRIHGKSPPVYRVPVAWSQSSFHPAGKLLHANQQSLLSSLDYVLLLRGGFEIGVQAFAFAMLSGSG